MREGWVEKKLGNLCVVLDSQRKPVAKINRKKGIFPYYGANGLLDYVDDYIFEGKYVLLGEDGANWDSNASSSYIVDGKIWVNNHAHVIKVNNLLNDEYLVYYLNYKDLNKYISGAIIKKLTQSSLKEINIEYPDLSFQEKIVSELDKISEMISKYDEQLKELDKLSQSIFYEMFGDPVENEKGWEVKIISDVSTYFNGVAHEQDIDDDGEFTLINSKFISTNGKVQKRTNKQHFPLLKNDLTMVLSDVPNGKALAKCYLVNEDNKYSLNQRICCFRGYEGAPLFFKYVVNRHQYFLSFNDGKGQTNLRKGDVEKMPIILPPLPLQQSFARKIEAIEAMKSKVREAKKEAETLLAARMQYWFE